MGEKWNLSQQVALLIEDRISVILRFIKSHSNKGKTFDQVQEIQSDLFSISSPTTNLYENIVLLTFM